MKGMRIRGEDRSHGVTGTVQGLGSPSPAPGYLFLFDKENIRAAIGYGRYFCRCRKIDTELIFPCEAARFPWL
jgi:hypothetical protein